MKKISLIAAVTILGIPAFAQIAGPNSAGFLYSTGDAGLTIHSNYLQRASISSASGGTNDLFANACIGFNIAHDGASSATLWTYMGDGASNAGFVMYGDVQGGVSFVSKLTTGISGGSLSNNDIRNYTTVKFDYTGKVVIGNGLISAGNYPGTYKLYVEDGIMTDKLKVALNNTSDWSDFVFESNYSYPTLGELETYVKKEKHLPGMPSANEVVTNGIDVAQMQSKLLQKIEELTLYVIQQQKEIDTIKAGKKKR